MKIIGLTGSIGMGKTTAAEAFRRLGVPVHDADREIHKLMAAGGPAVAAIAEAFAGVESEDAGGRTFIDRQALAARVFGDDQALKKLENILHPMVRQSKNKFLAAAARRRQKLVVLDIPLLLETGGEEKCDAVAVVSAPYFVQKRRVLQRPGMTLERFHSIVQHQMPDAEKRRRADFIIRTGLGRAHSRRSIAAIIKIMSSLDQRHA